MTGSRVWLGLPVLAFVAIAVWASFGSDPVPLVDENGAGLDTIAESAAGGAGLDHKAIAPNEASSLRTAADPLLGPGACGLRGRLLRDGEPVVGAEVHAMVWSYAPDERAVVRSDSAGRFAIVLEPATYGLVVHGGGIRAAFEIGPVHLRVPRVLDLGDLAVPEPVRLSGRVLDETGSPLAGVRVTVNQKGRGSRSLFAMAGRWVDRGVETDARGRFVFEDLRATKAKIRAAHPERYSRTREVEDFVDGRADVGDLVLGLAVPLRGYVVDRTGAPVVGASVMAGGARYESLKERAAVATGADGSFELRGFGRKDYVTVVMDGFEPAAHEVDAKVQPVRVEIAPAVPIDGRVIGAAGRAGTFELDDPEGVFRYSAMHALVRRPLYTRQPLAEDGSFHVDHVPPGRWMLSARVPGLGSVAPFEIEVPVAEPLELVPVADRQVEVTVVDDRGEPVASAEVARVEIDHPYSYLYRDKTAAQNGRVWFGWGTRVLTKVDERGRATIAAPFHATFGLAAHAPLHGYSSVLRAPGEGAVAARLVLPRFGAIAGHVADASLTRHLRLEVHGSRIGTEERGAHASVDAAGRFATAAVPPGRYRLGLTLADAARGALYGGLPVFEPLPVVCDRSSVIEPVEVEVAAGEVTEVELPAPVVGEVQGRVLAGARPVAGAIVFAHVVGAHVYRELDELDAHSLLPHCVTGVDGRFTFLVGVDGPIELRARDASAPAWCAPVSLSVAPGEIRTQDITLPAATVRGRYHFGDVSFADRRFLTAQLHPIAMAPKDPYASGHHAIPLYWGQQRQDLGADGTFLFEGLQPGTWILRLVGRSDDILVQRVVAVVADETFEIGLLEPPRRVVPQLACGLGPKFGVRWLRVVEGAPEGLFVRAVTRGREDWSWPAVAPGRYRLQAIALYDNFWSRGALGEPKGDPVVLEVGEDGTCSPGAVWPMGL